jgi:hypothetical protein
VANGRAAPRARCLQKNEQTLGLGGFHELGERLVVVHGQIGKHLAIDLDAGSLETRDHAAVGQAERTRGRIDARDPKPAKIVLAFLASDGRVVFRMEQRLVCAAEEQVTRMHLALGQLEHFLVAAVCDDAALYSGQLNLPIGSRPAECAHAPGADPSQPSLFLVQCGSELLDLFGSLKILVFDAAVERSFVTLGFSAAQVRLADFGPHDLSRRSNLKALGGRLVGFDLGHAIFSSRISENKVGA